MSVDFISPMEWMELLAAIRHAEKEMVRIAEDGEVSSRSITDMRAMDLPQLRLDIAVVTDRLRALQAKLDLRSDRQWQVWLALVSSGLALILFGIEIFVKLKTGG